MLDLWVCEKVGWVFQIRADQKQVAENHRPVAPIPVDNVRGRVGEVQAMEICQEDIQMDPQEAPKGIPENPAPEKSVSLLVLN